MTLIKIYECDICKQEGQDDELMEVNIADPNRRSPSKEKHAHKECLIKVGLLSVEEPPVIQPNVFLALAEGATAAGQERTFLETQEGPLVGTERDDQDDDEFPQG